MSSENYQMTEQITPGVHEQIALRAHQLWEERGCPIGSPQEDWLRAEQEICQETATDGSEYMEIRACNAAA